MLPGAVVTILVVVAVDVLSFMVLLPIIDTFCQSLGASESLIGTQFTVYSVAALISSFVVGRISDRYGRKSIFLFSACGTLIAAVGCIFVVNFTQFLLFTALSGLCTGTVGTAYAYIGDIVHNEKERSRFIAYTTATMSMCFVLGPLVGGLIASFLTIRSPFYFSAVIAFAEIVLVWKYLKNPRELKQQSQYEALLSSTKNEILEYYDQPNSQSNSFSHQSRVESGNNDYRSASRATSFSEMVVAGTMRSSFSIPVVSNTMLPVVALPDEVSPEHHVQFASGHGDAGSNRSAALLKADEDDIFSALDEESRLQQVFYEARAHTAQEHIDEQTGELIVESPKGVPFDESGSPLMQQQGSGLGNPHDSDAAKQQSVAVDGNPWCDTRALLVGGLGTALNILTYLGLIALVPLILEDARYGIVDDQESEPSDNDTQTISRYMGYYLGAYGCTQVLGMVFLFPRFETRFGLLRTGALGSLLYGCAFLLLLWLPAQPVQLFAVCVPMALGNSLCRPVFPSYLGRIASQSRRAEYMAITASFSNLALMIGGQMTLLYSTFSATGAILLCGSASILNAILLLGYSMQHRFHTSKP